MSNSNTYACVKLNETEQKYFEAFCNGEDIINFPESILSQDFIIKIFINCAYSWGVASSNRKKIALTIESIPAKYWTTPVKEAAVHMCTNNLQIIPYDDQTPNMINSLIYDVDQRYYSSIGIKYANPLLLTRNVLIELIETSGARVDGDIADKYMELVEIHTSKVLYG